MSRYLRWLESCFLFAVCVGVVDGDGGHGPSYAWRKLKVLRRYCDENE